ncbi:MAG: hypothetical protein HYS07_04295 [Chlamydiae bacterium]|nr:hypothetical protein [Chlamydiota bacterium]MBI3277419.1 hypothetical protein [Chlamydiota bacterium]
MENTVQHQSLELNDDLLKEIFALSTASTDYEVNLAYDAKNEDFWQKENLNEVYKLGQQKREYALDSLRGVLSWLNRHNYEIHQEGQKVDLSNILNTLVQKEEEE